MALDVTPDLSEVWGKLKGRIRSMGTLCTRVSNESTAGDTEIDLWLNMLERLADSITEINNLKTTPGLVQYVKDERNDQTIDIVTEFNTAVAAMTTLATNVRDAVPGYPGYAEIVTVLATGYRERRTFTTAQTAGVRADIDAFLATITMV